MERESHYKSCACNYVSKGSFKLNVFFMLRERKRKRKKGSERIKIKWFFFSFIIVYVCVCCVERENGNQPPAAIFRLFLTREFFFLLLLPVISGCAQVDYHYLKEVEEERKNNKREHPTC